MFKILVILLLPLAALRSFGGAQKMETGDFLSSLSNTDVEKLALTELIKLFEANRSPLDKFAIIDSDDGDEFKATLVFREKKDGYELVHQIILKGAVYTNQGVRTRFLRSFEVINLGIDGG